MAELKDRITLENLMEQALKIPKVKVDRSAFLSEAFAKEGILVRQIVEEGPVACDYSDIELDAMAEKLILRRTSESSALSFAAGIPGGLAVAATIPADTLQFFAMSLRLAQELAYLYGAKDFWNCDGEEGVFVRYQLICSLGAMFGITGAPAATRLLSSHLALRAVGGTPQRATTRAFWDPIVKRISRELVLRLTTDTASKGVAKLIPVIGGFFSGIFRFFLLRFIRFIRLPDRIFILADFVQSITGRISGQAVGLTGKGVFSPRLVVLRAGIGVGFEQHVKLVTYDGMKFFLKSPGNFNRQNFSVFRLTSANGTNVFPLIPGKQSMFIPFHILIGHWILLLSF